MAMVYFLAQDGETRVAMDSESTVSVNLPSTVARSSNMSGTSLSDDVIEGNPVISVQGKVTYSKLPSQEKHLNPIDFQKELQVARRNRKRFTLYIKNNGQPLLDSYDDCVISGVNITVDKYSDTITVNMTFEQVFVSAAAKATYLKPLVKASDAPSLSSTTDSGNGAKVNVTKDYGATIAKAVREIFQGTRPVFGGTDATNN